VPSGPCGFESAAPTARPPLGARALQLQPLQRSWCSSAQVEGVLLLRQLLLLLPPLMPLLPLLLYRARGVAELLAWRPQYNPTPNFLRGVCASVCQCCIRGELHGRRTAAASPLCPRLLRGWYPCGFPATAARPSGHAAAAAARTSLSARPRDASCRTMRFGDAL
jgi:hypothetical protein